MSDTKTPLPKTSQPAERALLTIGIDHLEQLDGKSEREITNLHGMGPKAMRILKAAMNEKGLAFASPE